MINGHLIDDTFDEVSEITRMGVRTSDVEELMHISGSQVRSLARKGIIKIKHVRNVDDYRRFNIYNAKSVLAAMKDARNG